jgi:hypothetical protein
MNSDADNPLMNALREFDATDANLIKLEKLCQEIEKLVPREIVFGYNPSYDDLRRIFMEVLAALPMIDGWKPECHFDDLDDIAQARLDAYDIDEPRLIADVENSITFPRRELQKYRFEFNKKRRALIQDMLSELIDTIDSDIRNLNRRLVPDIEMNASLEDPEWDALQDHVNQIDTLLGSSVKRPQKWDNLNSHLRSRRFRDFCDIEQIDWPSVKSELRKSLSGAYDPVPVRVKDLSDLVASRPTGPVATRLDWGRLTEDDFERLIFALISTGTGYENPEWLTKPHAPDRGRDLSVTRVVTDPLAGTIRNRVIIQCKHWLSKSISIADVATLSAQMKSWEPPRVDVLVIATSGRFSSDAVTYIERHNQSDNALRIEMWPESHLERILAAIPSLIADFKLR